MHYQNIVCLKFLPDIATTNGIALGQSYLCDQPMTDWFEKYYFFFAILFGDASGATHTSALNQM